MPFKDHYMHRPMQTKNTDIYGCFEYDSYSRYQIEYSKAIPVLDCTVTVNYK
jgi:hypothetical protein